MHVGHQPPRGCHSNGISSVVEGNEPDHDGPEKEMDEAGGGRRSWPVAMMPWKRKPNALGRMTTAPFLSETIQIGKVQDHGGGSCIRRAPACAENIPSTDDVQ